MVKNSNIIVERGRRDITQSEHGTISMGRNGIALYRLLLIKTGMELEMKGIRLTRKIPSAFTIARKEFGLSGNKRRIYENFCDIHGFDCKPVSTSK